MAESEQSRRKSSRVTRTEDETDAGAAPPALAESDTKAELDTEVDSLLDEIDEVLESNAEEFVRSFVQKGGQ